MRDGRIEGIEVAALRGLDKSGFVHCILLTDLLYSILTDCRLTL